MTGSLHLIGTMLRRLLFKHLPWNSNLSFVATCPTSLIGHYLFSTSTSAPSDLETEYKSEIDFIEKRHEYNQMNKQRLTGIVVSDRASKSISVRVKHFNYISKYGKYLPVRKKIMAHDENEVDYTIDSHLLLSISIACQYGRHRDHCTLPTYE